MLKFSCASSLVSLVATDSFPLESFLTAIWSDSSAKKWTNNIGLGASVALSATGMLGFDKTSYSDSIDNIKDPSRDITYDTIEETYTMTIVNAGADLFVSYRLMEHFGLFANVAARYLIKGEAIIDKEASYKEGRITRTDKFTYDLSDLQGKFKIQPTIGVIWRF